MGLAWLKNANELQKDVQMVDKNRKVLSHIAGSILCCHRMDTLQEQVKETSRRTQEASPCPKCIDQQLADSVSFSHYVLWHINCILRARKMDHTKLYNTLCLNKTSQKGSLWSYDLVWLLSQVLSENRFQEDKWGTRHWEIHTGFTGNPWGREGCVKGGMKRLKTSSIYISVFLKASPCS